MDRFFKVYRTTIDFREVIFHLVVTALLCFLVGMLYVLTARKRQEALPWARLFPLLGMGMALVATVLGSSLAIAIGMVGAVSVVRYRAVLKDLEALSFLFLTIAVGLAGGSHQLSIVLLALPAISVVLLLRKSLQVRRSAPLALSISGAPAEVFAFLPALESAYPALKIHQGALSSGLAEWHFSLPVRGPQELLALHTFLSTSAQGLQFSLSDEVETI